MTAALAIVKTGPVSLSPARKALAECLGRVVRAQSEVERVSRPVERLRDQLRVAEDELATAQANLEAVDAGHAAALRDQAKSGASIDLGKPPASAKAEQAVSDASRLCANLRAALAETEGDANTARIRLRDLRAEAANLTPAVIEEEFSAAIDRRDEARVAFIRADAESRALANYMSRRGRAPFGTVDYDVPWMEAARRALETYGKELVAVTLERDVEAAFARWKDAVARLSSDATADRLSADG